MAILWIWTALSVAWWLAAFLLIRRRRPSPPATAAIDRRRITVFKPLPGPVGERELGRLRACLTSFAAELDDGSEMLIGCHARDEDRLRALAGELRRAFPDARVRLVPDPDPDRFHANPKVSWMRILARHAGGELWLWSDADIEAPAGYLRSLRADLAAGDAGLLTSPYVVRDAGNAPELLDALYVNLELHPGVLLFGRLDRIRFGLGSGMLFAAEDFRRRVDWDDLGSRLADDHRLGRLLSPGRLGTCRVTTLPASETWTGALLHYLRWQKTVSWCRPRAYAAQLVILPILGWLACLPWRPEAAVPGLLGVLALDAAAALAVCRALGCPVGWRLLPALPLWSLARGLSWAACWLPWPVVWRGRRWWSPRRRPRDRRRLLEADNPPGLD